MIVKICGITDPNDAVSAAQAGADWIGILLTRRSKRFVEKSLAEEIAAAAVESGLDPVAVFGEESYSEILNTLDGLPIRKVQLHGTVSRQAANRFSAPFEIIYALSVNDGENYQPIPSTSQLSHFLYDSAQPGSGTSFSWETKIKPPHALPWLLAGGLNSSNIQQAIRSLNPHGVDVSTGVSDLNSVSARRKDPALMKEFVKLVRGESWFKKIQI